MSLLAQTRKETEDAWRSFVVDGRLPRSVRADILRSWQRTQADWHVDPRLQICPNRSGAEDAAVRAEFEDVLCVASSTVSEFARRLGSEGHVVAYFDSDGVMLALDGNTRTRDRLAQVNFAPGACWAEQAAGTNGPGMALAEGRPVEVFASEHYVEAWQPWTCASVPVRSQGRMVGVVDITSPWTAHHPGLLLTAEALAETIQARLEAAAARRQSSALLHMLRGAVGAREEFLSVVSHELKTPLTPLRLELQCLQRLVARSQPTFDPDHVVQTLRGADWHVGRVVKVIDDLLDASRVSFEPLRLTPSLTDLGVVVRSVVHRHRRELERQGCHLSLSVKDGVVGHWDRARVEQAFRQLLLNALKYAPGRIHLGIEADPGSARLVVRDEGPGISPGDQERIFQPFERAVSTLHISGFGLGLHLVRQIAEAHGGGIHLVSELGKGSTFVLELPLAPAEVLPLTAESRAERDAPDRGLSSAP